MNLPFFRPREKAREETFGVTAPTRLVTNTSVRRELVPKAPDKYQTETLKECLIYGFFEGLFEIGFDMKILAGEPNIGEKLLDNDYLLPEFIWGKINNEQSCRAQAWVIFTMMRFAQLWHAYRMIEGVEQLEGRELALLQLELSGEEIFLERLAEVQPFLPQLGLDKGRTQGEGNSGVEYTNVLSLFLETRDQFVRVHKLRTDMDIAAFIVLEMEHELKWPGSLVRAFYDSRVLLRTIGEIKKYFLIPALHPHLFRQPAE